MPLREVRLAQARAQIAALASAPASSGEVLAFGDARVDGRLPGGGLTLGCWHELAGEGLELETAAAPAAFAACLARPMARRGEIVWVLRRDDLYAPGLAGLGFPAERLIQVCARDEAEALAVIEDALRTPGVWAVFGEAEGVGLVEGRRLQLACERGSAAGFILRRRPYGGRPLRTAGSAAATRWRIAAAPSEPAPGETGLGPPRWRVALERCRGGWTGAWLMEAWEDQDAAHPFRVVAELADRGLAAEAPLRRAG